MTSLNLEVLSYLIQNTMEVAFQNHLLLQVVPLAQLLSQVSAQLIS